jgi:hypothetical protein
MTPGPPSTEWREERRPDEAERFEGYAAFFGELQKRIDRKGGAGRALHRKAHAGVLATFEVLPDLPAEARAGLFVAPASYRAYVRYSNGTFLVQHDRAPDVRGLAVKVVGVEGQKLIPGLEDRKTQDFLFIHVPAIAFKDADEFVAFARAAQQPLLALPRLLARFGLKRTLSLVGDLRSKLAAPASLADRPFYTAVPLRMGDHAGKLSLRPLGAAGGEPRRGATYLGDDLAERLRRGPLRYDVCVQLFRDPVTTPIEDASVEWTNAAAPPITVARLTIEQQDVDSARGQKVAAFVERLSFDPWHALVDHRPLGDVMRARSPAYRVSTQARGAAAEPDGSETFE